MEEKFGYTHLAGKAFQIITYAGMTKSHPMGAIYKTRVFEKESEKKENHIKE